MNLFETCIAMRDHSKDRKFDRFGSGVSIVEKHFVLNATSRSCGPISAISLKLSSHRNHKIFNNETEEL